MRNSWFLVSSIVQLFFGTLAIISFIILAVNGENLVRWLFALILAIVYVIIGTIGIIDYIKNK